MSEAEKGPSVQERMDFAGLCDGQQDGRDAREAKPALDGSALEERSYRSFYDLRRPGDNNRWVIPDTSKRTDARGSHALKRASEQPHGSERHLAPALRTTPLAGRSIPESKRKRADFLLPVPDLNPFFDKLCSSPQALKLLKELTDWRNWCDTTHFLLLGPSGCGRTTMGLSVGTRKYMVYLECPSSAAGMDDCHHHHCADAITVDGLGFMMTGKVWAPSEKADREEAYRMADMTEMREFICAEIITRLMVMLEWLDGREAPTPLDWLFYQLTDEGSGRRVHETFLKVVSDKSKCSYDEACALLRKVATIIGYRPMLMIDEFHHLTETSMMLDSYDGRDGHWHKKRKTIAEVMMTSLMELPCPVIFSRTDDIKVERKQYPDINEWDVTVFEDFSWAEEQLAM